MADNTELNDIILNKSNGSFGSFKKILLAVATFAVLLIIVIVVMSSLGGKRSKGLKNTILPPEPTKTETSKTDLFKSVDVVEEKNDDEQKRLESIANELKNQALDDKDANSAQTSAKEDDLTLDKNPEEVVVIDAPYKKRNVTTPSDHKRTKTTKSTASTKTTKVASTKSRWYVQVGSFEKSNQHKRLISKIKRSGYKYRSYRSKVKGKYMTKILIGPFKSYKDAQKKKPKIAATIEPAAFIYRMPK